MADTSRAKVVANLKALQTRVNASSRSRNAFLNDPGAALRKEGVVLTPDRERKLTSFIDKQINTPGAVVSGAAVRPGGSAVATEVEVTVKVKF